MPFCGIVAKSVSHHFETMVETITFAGIYIGISILGFLAWFKLNSRNCFWLNRLEALGRGVLIRTGSEQVPHSTPVSTPAKLYLNHSPVIPFACVTVAVAEVAVVSEVVVFVVVMVVVVAVVVVVVVAVVGVHHTTLFDNRKGKLLATCFGEIPCEPLGAKQQRDDLFLGQAARLPHLAAQTTGAKMGW